MSKKHIAFPMEAKSGSVIIKTFKVQNKGRDSITVPQISVGKRSIKIFAGGPTGAISKRPFPVQPPAGATANSQSGTMWPCVMIDASSSAGLNWAAITTAWVCSSATSISTGPFGSILKSW